MACTSWVGSAKAASLMPNTWMLCGSARPHSSTPEQSLKMCYIATDADGSPRTTFEDSATRIISSKKSTVGLWPGSTSKEDEGLNFIMQKRNEKHWGQTFCHKAWVTKRTDHFNPLDLRRRRWSGTSYIRVRAALGSPHCHRSLRFPSIAV